MNNVDMKVTGDILTVTIDLSKEYGLSASEKSISVASTNGNISVPEHADIKIGINVYKKAGKK